MKKPVPSLLNTPGPEIDTRNKTNRIIQQSIARGHDDLANGRVQPWKQAKAEADRMRAPSQSSPPCNHPVNHSGALEFCCDAVAPGAPLC